jgi:hypothetical protein
LFTLSIGLLAADSVRNTGNPNYSFWISPLAFGAYITAVIALTCLVCGIFNISFPNLGGSRRRGPAHRTDPALSGNILSDEDLRDIKVKMHKFANLTGAERQRLFGQYSNLWVQFPGTVVDVGPWDGTCSRVTIKPDVRGLTMYLNFTDRDVFDTRLSIATRNRRMTVRGQIVEIGANWISFANCRIVQ